MFKSKIRLCLKFSEYTRLILKYNSSAPGAKIITDHRDILEI